MSMDKIISTPYPSIVLTNAWMQAPNVQCKCMSNITTQNNGLMYTLPLYKSYDD